MSRTIRVPLAVDAQVRIPLGPVEMPMRALILLGLIMPFALIFLSVTGIPASVRFGGVGFAVMAVMVTAAPMYQGIWIGTHALYKQAHRVLPTAVIGGVGRRAEVRLLGNAVHVSNTRDLFVTKQKALNRINHYTGIPTVSGASEGIITLKPGGARAILMVEGPTMSIGSETYLGWCGRMMNWLTSLDCPVQFLSVVTHYDSQKAELAFDRRTQAWPRTILRDMERRLAGSVADQSLGLRHYVVLCPNLAGSDGMPPLSRLTKSSSHVEAPVAEAERVLHSAQRLASTFGIEAEIPDRDDVAELLRSTLLGATEASTGNDVLHISGQHHVVMTVTKLPPAIEVGVVVEAIMRARTRGMASLHIFPVDPSVARKIVGRRASIHQYSANQGGDQIDSAVALSDAQDVLASIAQRTLKPCRVALTMSVSHPELSGAHDAAERLGGLLAGHGFDITSVNGPGFLPALALCPGMPPLGRSLQLTSDDVALRMLPALGTPFSDSSHPLVGTNALTGAPAYFSVWSRPNHNVVIVGSSGAGKSVATKTLLVRHVMEGVSAVVIDPDSEYRPVMDAIGGQYYELGQEALNPFAAGVGLPPDTAASLVIPILSVMGGDEKGIRDGRPIRRLPDEDQGWLHAEVAEFYRRWNEIQPGAEPVMSNVIAFIETESRSRALTPVAAERCRIITARLRRFTQGKRADVFDRPSTFTVGVRPVAIGLKTFAMSYAADLTPALAVVLTSILAAIDRREGRMVVVVDEAHRVTSDPDAGEVLGQLVRQARKYGAGVWMCSQRVEDFVSTDLGKTLAATASTKLILGTEEASVEDVAEVFKLTGEEVASINPIVQGRGVLISGNERTVVRIVPGNALLALSDTSSALRSAAKVVTDNATQTNG